MPVAHCPGPLSAIPLGECALMFTLMLARRYQESHALLREGVLHQPLGRNWAASVSESWDSVRVDVNWPLEPKRSTWRSKPSTWCP
ncbi:hypothetical protein CM1200mP19_1640 [bacterium]|nr:MAG: hypothetical protein CM1200mP19_1640 [bacterium]